MASSEHALTEAPRSAIQPSRTGDRSVNSEPRPCLISVGFPLSGPQDRILISDLIRHALRTYGLAPSNAGGSPTLQEPTNHQLSQQVDS
jgi:hypothetical protein